MGDQKVVGMTAERRGASYDVSVYRRRFVWYADIIEDGVHTLTVGYLLTRRGALRSGWETVHELQAGRPLSRRTRPKATP